MAVNAHWFLTAELEDASHKGLGTGYVLTVSSIHRMHAADMHIPVLLCPYTRLTHIPGKFKRTKAYPPTNSQAPPPTPYTHLDTVHCPLGLGLVQH